MNNHRLHVLAELADEIRLKRQGSPEESYTARLISRGIPHCAKKFGEESFELALAATAGSTSEAVAEAADVIYHMLVLLEACEVPLAAVMAELARRRGMSGLAEKASRPVR
jgi:phosphoribosyl-ATP pyrophosphohydrolase